MALAEPARVEPLGPALAGQLQCYSPNEAEKTCQSIDRFRPLGNGRFSDAVAVRLVGDPLIIAEFTLSYGTKGDAFCNMLRPGDLAAARITKSGRPMPAKEAAALRRLLIEAMASYMNKEACTVLEESDEGLVARTRVNGVYDPGVDQYVKWVDPADGYRVAP
jgi:hypothetical protein